jgi:diguanylate cyclase (GGDEF)-like protein
MANGLSDINENRGHEFGDRVLVQVAKNIQNALRSCDAVARLGGTKFVALLEPLGVDENVHVVSERVAEAVAVPVEVGGVSVNLSATIGVTLYPTSVASPSALLRNATTAMDYAMDRGAGSIHIV